MRLYLRWASRIHILLVRTACQGLGLVVLTYIPISIATLGKDLNMKCQVLSDPTSSDVDVGFVDNRFDMCVSPEVSSRKQLRIVPTIPFLDADAGVAEGVDPEELECTRDAGHKFEQTPSAQSFSSPCPPPRHMAEPGHLNRRSPPPPPRLSRVSNMCNLNWDMVPVLDQDGLLDPGGPEAQMTAPTQEFLVAWRTRTEAQLQVSVA